MSKTLSIAIIFICLFEDGQAQKGEKSISAGPLVSFPINADGFGRLTNGAGFEAIGQYNFSKNSAILLQTGWTFYRRIFGYYDTGYNDTIIYHVGIFSFKAGYKYQFINSGFFTNALLGVDKETHQVLIGSFTVGGGKRFTIKENYFIDTGVDYISGRAERRLNIKATFSLLRWPK